ncbi:MAG: hypothetical protein K9N48_08450, partial [Verrucomicrobia bacterium]|nr:hypothetical protein [Verrucomicrobiota bacterium]
MEPSSLLSRKHTAKARSTEDTDKLPAPLTQAVMGMVFILNAFILDLLVEKGGMISGISAMMGAVILIYPIAWASVKNLKRGVLSINELVSIAVLAAFASGQYQIAGIVAFFMLIGEVIESRTA